jgi:outer membrane protein OmpA-like peptidoglycan-associated protein
MKAFLLSILLSSFFFSVHAQKYVGPPRNVGREFGNPKMPWMVSHLAGPNKEMLRRANKNSRHSIFGKILCFRKLCRIQSGHTAPLRLLTSKQFERKVERNARKGLYKKTRVDSTFRRNPASPVVPRDTATATPAIPLAKPDSLIVLGAELLFETNKSTLRREHFETLRSIVDYLMSHPERFVQISGHTDNTGVEGYNLALSKRRAEVVAEYLVNNGVDVKRVASIGFGSAKPIALNATENGRRKNRRVELLIHDQ